MTMVALLLAVAAGHAAAVDLDLYLTAARSGVAGEVAGRAYEERRRLDLPEQPLPGTTVTLLPSPDALLQYLEGVKRDARDSPDAFRSAIPRMLEAQEQHERAVRAAGGDSLVRSAVAAADGTFTLPGVPAGAWILIGRHETAMVKTGHGGTRKDRETYRLGPALAGYRTVRIWIRDLSVDGGTVVSVALTDRNVWFSGVVEVKTDRR